jgi:hypothetical protein
LKSVHAPLRPAPRQRLVGIGPGRRDMHRTTIPTRSSAARAATSTSRVAPGRSAKSRVDSSKLAHPTARSRLPRRSSPSHQRV